MRIIEVEDGMTSLLLGRQGENKRVQFVFDVSEWLEEYPEADITLINQLPHSRESYPVMISGPEDGKIRWTVCSTELQEPEYGQCELMAIEGEVVVKSHKWRTQILESLDGGGEAPDPWDSWLEEFARLKIAAEDAAEDAEDAKEAAETAQGLAEDARDAAQAAAGNFQGMTAEVEGLDADDDPTIEVEHEEGGLYNFKFGTVPGTTFTPAVSEQGVLSWTNDGGKTNPESVNIKGPQGDPAPVESIVPAVENWLEENITEPEYPLDSTLFLQNAAAPANLVGNLKSAMDENFNIEEKTVFNSFSDQNATNSIVSNSPYVLHTAYPYGALLTAIKLNVSTAGKLSIGYYQGKPVIQSEYDSSKIVITNELTISTTGIMTVQLPNPYVVPVNCSLLVCVKTDTVQFKYGEYGTEKKFIYVYGSNTAFSESLTSLGVNFIGYTLTDFSEKINRLKNEVDVLKNYLFIKKDIVDGYSESNTTNGTFSTAPYVLDKDIGADCVIYSATINVRDAGMVSFGTIKKEYVGSGVSFDSSKLNIFQTIKVTETGVQTVLINGMYVHEDEYVFYGLKSDTLTFKYGNDGTDKRYFYISSQKYTVNNGSANVTLNGFVLENKTESTYSGKSLSILGDSISTFSGYLPEGNETYYPSGTVQSVTDTWWKKLIDSLGMTLNVNNSWSGSRVTTTAGETSAGCMERCQSLGTTPDVIIVWMGINDFNNEVNLGTYDGSTEMPTATNTFREAYAIMLNKILTAYPTSEVWVCTLPQCERNGETGFPEINGNDVSLLQFNKAILELAEAFGVKVLNHNKCGLTYQNMPTYNPDNLHPNKYGHSLIANNDIWQMDAAVRFRY